MSNLLHNLNQRVNFSSSAQFQKSTVSGINLLASRLEQHGSNYQEERMIKDKRRSLDKATMFSYQGAYVQKVSQFGAEVIENNPVRALINPNKLKQDYDDKIISIGFEHDFHVGDVFEWVNTGTKWLIYLQDLTELAYFRGDIRRCSYEIEWEDEDGHHKTYCAIRGPVETKINYIQKHQISVDQPNHSLDILMPKNDFTLKYFKRYSKFYLQDQDVNHQVCWRVQAIDWISTPGILEVVGVEYYANETEDNIDDGIVGGKLVKITDPNDENNNLAITGPVFIKPKIEYLYKFNGVLQNEWMVKDATVPVSLIRTDDYTEIKVKWNSSYSGQFVLNYGDFEKTIVVEALF